MKISVVIPNFNDLRVRRAVDSVRRQTYGEVELLIIDGGFAQPDLLSYYRVCGADRIVSERDGGIFDALNKGVRLASGDIIFLMGSDDELSDDRAFEDVAGAFRADPAIDGVCIGCEFVNAKGEVIRTWYPSRVSAPRIKRGILPPHFSLFLKTDLYPLVGDFKYKEFNNVACDILWLLDLAIRKPDLRIPVLPNHHLRMEYGGASTWSLSARYRQFRVVHNYAKANARHLSHWYLYSAVRTLSKIPQLKRFSP